MFTELFTELFIDILTRCDKGVSTAPWEVCIRVFGAAPRTFRVRIVEPRHDFDESPTEVTGVRVCRPPLLFLWRMPFEDGETRRGG